MTSWAAATPPASSVASTGTVRLISARPIGPSSWCRAADPVKPTAVTPVHPGFTTGQLDRVAVGGQPVHAAVQVQEDQPPRRVAEVVHPGHRLLAPVAALVQVHRGLDPADLVRDGPVIGIQAEPGHPRGDPQRLERPHARQRGPAPDQLGGRVGQQVPRHDQID